jgi:hypothetical protein
MGATIPQYGALSAARWSALTTDGPTLQAAFALEAMSNDLAYLLGSTLATTASALLLAPAGTLLAGPSVLTPAPSSSANTPPTPVVTHFPPQLNRFLKTRHRRPELVCLPSLVLLEADAQRLERLDCATVASPTRARRMCSVPTKLWLRRRISSWRGQVGRSMAVYGPILAVRRWREARAGGPQMVFPPACAGTRSATLSGRPELPECPTLASRGEDRPYVDW